MHNALFGTLASVLARITRSRSMSRWLTALKTIVALSTLGPLTPAHAQDAAKKLPRQADPRGRPDLGGLGHRHDRAFRRQRDGQDLGRHRGGGQQARRRHRAGHRHRRQVTAGRLHPAVHLRRALLADDGAAHPVRPGQGLRAYRPAGGHAARHGRAQRLAVQDRGRRDRRRQGEPPAGCPMASPASAPLATCAGPCSSRWRG